MLGVAQPTRAQTPGMGDPSVGAASLALRGLPPAEGAQTGVATSLQPSLKLSPGQACLPRVLCWPQWVPPRGLLPCGHQISEFLRICVPLATAPAEAGLNPDVRPSSQAWL